MKKPLVSVVIPTYARPERLRDCLGALARQTLPADTFEIVVVDDGSPRPIALPADTAQAGPIVRILRQPNAGPSAARNHGVAEARGELIALTDEAAAYFLASNNILCSRATYRELGGFDTTFPRAGAEDRDFCDRWRATGRPLRLVTSARLEHRHAQNLKQFLGLHYRYGRGAYLYQSKRRLRGSGTMKQDVNFHRRLLRRLPRHLRKHRGLVRKIQIAAAIMLWQMANALGFFDAAAAEAFQGRPRRK